MAFYDNYIRLCAAKGKSPSAVALEIGLKKSNVTYWKNNRNNPSDITLQKIAEYFGVSVDDLLIGQKEKSPAPEGAERIPGYSDLSATNKAIVDSMIAQLLAAQLED